MEDGHTFEQFFQTELIPTLQPLEDRRKAILRKATLAWIVTAVVAVPAAGVWLHASAGFAPLLVTTMVALAVGAMIVTLLSAGYRRDFKKQVVGPIVRYISPELSYAPAEGIAETRFLASGIFRKRIDAYRSEDLVQGTVGQTRVEFSEVKADHINKSGQKSSTETIFIGLFFIADFNKNFHGHTVVLPDIAEKLLGRLGQTLQAMDTRPGELVKLEDPEFERQFVVHSTDQVEARYILSTALMRRMLEFQRKTRATVYFSFTGGTVNIGIRSLKNRFEPRLKRSVFDIGMAREFISDLQFATGIVEDLNLNTRIWTKQ
jgi:hypothetical protein